MDEELTALLSSTVENLGLELVDVERRAASVRVVVDRPGGADLDVIAAATRAVSSTLDSHDPFPGHRYTLEVSSPGVERPLRTPQHFARALGEIVTVRTLAGGEGERRLTGRLASADKDGFVIEDEHLPGGAHRLAYGQIERARTVFEWGPALSPRTTTGQRTSRARQARPGAHRTQRATP